jgi:hypothetical protein
VRREDRRAAGTPAVSEDLGGNATYCAIGAMQGPESTAVRRFNRTHREEGYTARFQELGGAAPVRRRRLPLLRHTARRDAAVHLAGGVRDRPARERPRLRGRARAGAGAALPGARLLGGWEGAAGGRPGQRALRLGHWSSRFEIIDLPGFGDRPAVPVLLGRSVVIAEDAKTEPAALALAEHLTGRAEAVRVAKRYRPPTATWPRCSRPRRFDPARGTRRSSRWAQLATLLSA